MKENSSPGGKCFGRWTLWYYTLLKLLLSPNYIIHRIHPQNIQVFQTQSWWQPYWPVKDNASLPGCTGVRGGTELCGLASPGLPMGTNRMRLPLLAQQGRDKTAQVYLSQQGMGLPGLPVGRKGAAWSSPAMAGGRMGHHPVSWDGMGLSCLPSILLARNGMGPHCGKECSHLASPQ